MGDRLPVKCFMEKVDNKSEQYKKRLTGYAKPKLGLKPKLNGNLKWRQSLVLNSV